MQKLGDNKNIAKHGEIIKCTARKLGKKAIFLKIVYILNTHSNIAKHAAIMTCI